MSSPKSSLVFAIAASLCACATKAAPVEPPAAGASDASHEGNGGPAEQQPEATLPLLDTCSGPSDPVEIDGLQVEGDLLLVAVSHGGGCGEHTYQACWNGALAKSLPPQATIELRHDGHGDTCEAELSATVPVDVASLLQATGGSVVVHVGDQRILFE